MKHTKILTALTLSAVMLLSGCNTGTPEETTTEAAVTEQPVETADNADEQVFFEYEPDRDGVRVTRYVNEEIVIPETINGKPVTSFRGSALENTNIKKLTVKARIETLPTLCECELLTEIDLPSSITYFTPGVFGLCKALKAVNIEPGGDFCSVDGAVYTADMKKLLFVPYAAGKEITIPEGVEVIGDCAMQYSEATKVTLPSTLKEIGRLAFASSALESAELPAGIKKIGNSAFEKTKLREITLPEGLETIGNFAFSKTYLDNVYIPDSVTECDTDAFPYCTISAPAQLSDTSWMKNNSMVSFRGDSMLDSAIRQGIAKFKENFIFKDLTYDGFPELITFQYGRNNVYSYDSESNSWQDTYYSSFDNGEDLDGWVYREMRNILEADYPPGHSFYAIPTEDFIGKIEFYRVNETGKLLIRLGKLFYFEDGKGKNDKSRLYPEDCTLLWELTEETVKEKYKPLGTYIVFDGPFTDKPNGEIVTELTVNDEVITEMPYVMNLIPLSENVLINGSDILHGGSYEGVSFDYDTSTLILDNVNIEATDDYGICFMRIDYPQIKLIGDNRIVSAEKYSIEAFEGLTVLGDGTLTTGSMAVLTTSDSYRSSDLRIKENVTLKEAYPGAFADSAVKTVNLSGTSRIICGTADEPSRGLFLDGLYIEGDAVCDIYSSQYGIFTHDKLHAPIRVRTYENGKLNITSALDGITNRWSGGGEVYLNGNSEVNINAGRAGIDIDYDYGASTSGIVSLSCESKLTIRSKWACVRGYRLEVNGGTLDFMSGETNNAVAIKTDINGEIEYQEGGYGDEATRTLKLKVKEQEPEYDEYYYGDGAKEKPVIYLYPEEQTDVSVQVSFPYGGRFTCTYPDYGDGWNVTAMPDGTLYDADGNEYYCLYWEGVGYDTMSGEEGFCVAGADTADFLREKLTYIGLTPREANEFIIYWLPKMQDNPYNVITLHTDDYARSVPLDVSPMPDTQIRVFMTYRASDTPVDIPEQELPHYERNGFTLVEWGGSER